MKNHRTGLAVQQLRIKNLTSVVSTLAVFVAAVVTNMLVPQLLIKYVYDPTTLVTAPPIFEYLPLVTYGVALLYFIRVALDNFVREGRAKKMEREFGLGSCPECSDDEISDEELKELEKIVDEALKPKRKVAKRKTVKAARKTTKRKVSRKK